MTEFKQIVLTACCLILFVSQAMADQDIYLKPEEGMPDREQITCIVKAFFSERCGVSESDFPDTLDFAKYGYFGYGIIENDKEPVWLVGVSLPSCSRHNHKIILDKRGTVLYWASHGTEHWIDEPDILETAVPAVPQDTDVCKEAIVNCVQDKLRESGECDPDEIALLDYQPHFIYDKHLDNGYTPFWLVEVYQQEKLFRRALYTYDGLYLSMVKPNEDFSQYDSPNPLFSDVYPLSLEQWVHIPSLSVEEKYQEAEKMRPFVAEWMARYPYYLNHPGIEYDMTFRNHYAVPDELSISQEEAVAIAQTLGAQFGIGKEYMNSRSMVINYLLDDDHQPFWRVAICRAIVDAEIYRRDDSLSKAYVVKLDAHTGDVVDCYLIDADTPDYEWRY